MIAPPESRAYVAGSWERLNNNFGIVIEKKGTRKFILSHPVD